MLAIVINDQLKLQYDRSKQLPEHQQQYLSNLDNKFTKGLELQGEKIDDPNIEQKARYMSLILMESILYKEDSKAAVCLAWLATRLPDLKQLKAIVDDQGTQFELIFDREYQPHQVVNFDGLN